MGVELSDELSSAREQVAAASRRLATAGLVHGTAGNVSARVGELVALTPTGAQLAELSAQQVCVVDLAGTLIAGELEPTSELHLHLGVYERYQAGAVVHTHAPLACALSCVLQELPCVHYQMLALGGSIRVAPYHTFGSPELAAATLAALDGKLAALMANHGMITYAQDLEHAVGNVELLEWACDIYWHAATLGKPRTLSETELADVVATVMRTGYGTTRTRSE